MGSDINDINNDGLEDIYVLDMAVEDPVRQKQLFVVNQNYDKFELMVRFGLYYQYPKTPCNSITGTARSTRSAIMPAWLKASGAGHPYCGPRQRRLERHLHIQRNQTRCYRLGLPGIRARFNHGNEQRRLCG